MSEIEKLKEIELIIYYFFLFTLKCSIIYSGLDRREKTIEDLRDELVKSTSKIKEAEIKAEKLEREKQNMERDKIA